MVETAIANSRSYVKRIVVNAGKLGAVIKDPVFRTLIALIGILAIFDFSQVRESLVFTLQALWQMLPFFALAIGFAGYAKASNADALIAGVFSGNPVRATALAALVGAISPFCSCGVIPLIAALLGAGVPLAPVMAFWVASPIMDPEMFILTAAGIGLNFTIAKTLAAVGMGLLAGFTVLFLRHFSFLEAPLQSHVTGGGTSSRDSNVPPELNWRFWREPQRIRAFRSEIYAIGIFLGKWLAFAFFLESLMIAYVSPDWIVDYVGADNVFAIPLAAIVGMPSYLNGYAAIPLVSGLLDMGMTPGAAMAFITAGAVSSIPAAIAVFALVKKPVFALYLSLGVTGSILTAWLYQVSGGSI
ncbi:MAG: permease [Gammaproteobacteria bacterium]|nr:permease [Gammaproteobacteria bacterium]